MPEEDKKQDIKHANTSGEYKKKEANNEEKIGSSDESISESQQKKELEINNSPEPEKKNFKEDLTLESANSSLLENKSTTVNTQNFEDIGKKQSPFLTKSNSSVSPFLKKLSIHNEDLFLTNTNSTSSDIEMSMENEISYKKQQEQIDSATKDISVFNRMCKLYFLLPKTGKLETRGEGKLIILKDKEGVYRILMVRNKLMLKGCFHFIAPASNLIKATAVKNSWVWVAIDDKSDAEENYKNTTYFVTFGSEDYADEFEKVYKEGQEVNRGIFKKLREEQ